MSVQEQIKEFVSANPIVLFMKGTPQFPQCGFSATVAQILKLAGVAEYASVNVLADENVRQGIKEYANWPTIPQLYINGEFVGGCDIIREMYENGELQEMLKEAGANAAG
ncbi:Grx4 family monothiol glutaredoxin [Nitrogeniibacter mangrovi]|uniref:Glutaredoxin n=1 Tax=Nitrogeniibacter mangrovi TaxID=2016596 RepID=A0A6C1B0J9_9RHOO|nr:Grx4 family monothiol glutaredoxin [Nitrogeniibacter mangrovi]QID17126.1 Grx4 family monothiol glutaredoxin [Nitrogeniibacter mangrovi]